MLSQLFHSRKFLIMLVDVVISSITYFIGQYVSPEVGKNIIWLIGSWQPVIYAVIQGIAHEDAAVTAAMATENAAAITVGAPSSVPPVTDVPVAKQEIPQAGG